MSLKNTLISFIIVIAMIFMIIIAASANPITLASPQGEDLNPILVRTQTISYHDSAALYNGEDAVIIEDPHAVDSILYTINNISCKQNPLSAYDNTVTAATHRIRFVGGGVTLYLDSNSGCFWFDYLETIPNKYLIGYTEDSEGQRSALVYQVKDMDELNELVASLDAYAEKGMKAEYEYAALDDRGERYDFLTIDNTKEQLSKEDKLAKLEDIDGLVLPLNSNNSINFFLREKGLGIRNDLINIQALQPNQGGLRPMNTAFTFDPAQADTNVMSCNYKWDENFEITNYALFKVVVQE